MADSEGSILSQLISVLFPSRCAHCRAYGGSFCPECREALKPLGALRCRCCGKPSLYDVTECPECRGRRLHFRAAGAAFAYDGPARSLVHALKYSGQRRLAATMADLSADTPALVEASRGAAISFVPAYRSRQFKRGYNQAELYARALSGRLGAPVADLLLKCRPTVPQNRLNFAERGKNLSDSFSARAGCRLETEKVLLVDDVYTTGATVSECARVLTSDLGVVVDVWTFARTVKN
ncbi:MAG: double zinc ribbon domain-containing protein [Thermoleophilia bacterium]